MNVVKIMGGLGNQLFQYAFSKSLEKHDQVALDITYYESHFNHSPDIAHREFQLPCFVDGLTYATEDGLTRVNQWEYKPNREYKDSFFFGDWQKMSFFHGIDLGLKLRDEFISDQARTMAEAMHRVNSVAIHIRRTDYVNLGWALDMSYYNRAINIIRRNMEAPVFYIFSDDMEWAFNNIIGVNEVYVHEDTLNDIWLMSQCKHNIIANSTFSFWAAYLNENPEKTVIYPQNWRCPNPIDVNLERWIAV